MSCTGALNNVHYCKQMRCCLIKSAYRVHTKPNFLMLLEKEYLFHMKMILREICWKLFINQLIKKIPCKKKKKCKNHFMPYLHLKSNGKSNSYPCFRKFLCNIILNRDRKENAYQQTSFCYEYRGKKFGKWL